MFDSVRVRLTLWFTGILALILAVFATGVHLLVSQRLYGELDKSLRSTTDVIAASLKHEVDEHQGRVAGEQLFAGVLQTIHQAAFPRQAISVFDGARLVAAKPGLDGRTLPREGVGSAGLWNLPGAGGDQRIAVVDVMLPAAGRTYTIAVAEPVERTRAELADVRGILFIAVPFALLLAAGSGYVLARKSLAPVAAMTEQVNLMPSGRPGERLRVANPHDELGRLAVTFNGLLHRLDEALDQQRRFMADASHELRTPISISRTAAEVTLEGGDRDAAEYREALSVVAAQMQRLTRVVHDMFTLARADSGAYAVERRPFYLNDAVAEAMAAARLLAIPKQIRLHSRPLPESPYFGDEDLIRQLIVILLDNAIKYTPDGGSVDISIEPGYTILVSDTGIGMPEEAQEKIFERFYRIGKARSRSAANRSGGAGLGLAIGRWIAQVHGGTLRVRCSKPGEGSTFGVELPTNESVRGASFVSNAQRPGPMSSGSLL